jgi:hypothetical protein
MRLAVPRSRSFAFALACSVASALVASGSGLLIGACGADIAAEGADDAAAPDGSRRDAARADGAAPATDEDGGSTAPPDVASCETLKAYYKACGGDPLCALSNPKWDTWCVGNTVAVDSDAYRLATTRCATADKCGADKRKDCMYRAYGDMTQSVAQEQLATAYCEMCQPGDLAGCRKRTVGYNTAGGPGAVSSEFLAVWELSDTVVQKVRTTCTGAGSKAYDGGVNAGACAKAFDDCAGGFYVDAFLDCPR